MRAWHIYTFAGFQEDLQLRPYGVLRHVINKNSDQPQTFDYPLDQYCVDGVQLLDETVHSNTNLFHGESPVASVAGPTYYALVCAPGPRTEMDYFEDFVRVVYPIGLGIGIMVLVSIVGVHFILPELRDLSGCMLISLKLSLVVSMIGNLVLSSTAATPTAYVNLLVLESVVHGSDVAVHFWLNAIGHRAWVAVR